nr:RNA-directed DNA polymerase, eukaryota, reverse transcriptase zinc-binding domain protein [Tanacetum cinerariifolium]
MGSQRSKEDDVHKISTSVFITNFPDMFSAKDLFNTCKQYGHVVDAFIPIKRTKAGKRFCFVRFIKIFDVERLVNNLCTVWVGRFKLHANIARFQRTPLDNESTQVKNKFGENRSSTNDYMKDKGVNGVANSYVHAVKGRPQSVNMEIEFTPALVLDDECLNSKDLSNSLLGRVKEFASLSNLKMVLTNEGFDNINIKYMGEFWLIQVSMDFTNDGRVAWVEIEEDDCFHTKRMCINTKAGMNIFESFKIIFRGKVFWIHAKEVPGWVPDFMEETDEGYVSDDGSKERGLKVEVAYILGGESDVEKVPETKFEERLHNNNLEEVSTGQKDKHSEDPFNIYALLNKKKEHCKKDGESKKESGEYSQGDHEEEINTGIDEKSSNKGSNEDVAEGVWLKNGNDILIVSVCAPQELTEKKTLLDYLAYVINNWNDEVVIMRDFNEVRSKTKRFGSIFNVQGANVFNRFIDNAGLKKVPLGGSSFTWYHKSATKMSKLDRFLISESLMSSCSNILAITLERYLSDHRPILLLKDAWIEAPVDESNDMTNMMKKLKYLKQKIREWNKGNVEVVKQRMDVIKSLQDLENLQSLETAQKAKIKWAIEGDDNSKYYHGVLNKKRSQLNIRGILVDGIWTDNPSMVKCEFLQHFKKVELELEVSKEEIKRAVWDCGTDKSPGPDGFTFGFYRGFWKVIENDVVDVFTYFLRMVSPVKEFQFYKGLKQGDPLSPFLFILIMESLHISFQRVVDAEMFKGITLSTSLQLSHMFYVDDAVFVGQWSDVDVDTIVHVLECFFRASGLRINMSKSKLMGISVEEDKVEQVASKIGFLILKPLLESIRSHFFSGHDLNGKETSWVKWKIMLPSKEKGLAIHGDDGKVGKNVRSDFPSIWLDIVHEMDVLKKQDIDIGWCGTRTIFSFDGPGSRFSLVPMKDRRIWSLESLGDFSVDSVRKLIGDKMLPKVATKTRWIKFVPIKVNVHAWKVRLDSLPTRLNISRRRMDIDSITCPKCDNGVEPTSHLFFTCHIASEMFRKISCWWDVSYMEISSYEDWLNWLVNLRLSNKHKQVLEGVFYVMWWHIWSFRNKSIFGSKIPSMAMIFEDVVSRSFYGCRFRCKASFSWIDWLKNPYLVSL